MSKVLKVPKVLGRQVLENKALRVKGLGRPECFNGTEDPISASMIQRDQRSPGSRVSRDRRFPPLYPAPLDILTLHILEPVCGI